MCVAEDLVETIAPYARAHAEKLEAAINSPVQSDDNVVDMTPTGSVGDASDTDDNGPGAELRRSSRSTRVQAGWWRANAGGSDDDEEVQEVFNEGEEEYEDDEEDD